MSTRAEFFQSMYPGLSNDEVIDELIKASIYGFEHGPEVVTISAAEGIHYVPYDAEMQKKLPYYGGTYEACNIPFTDDDPLYEVVQTSHGYTLMAWEPHRNDWYSAEIQKTPEDLRNALLDTYANFLEDKITGNDRDLTVTETGEIQQRCRELWEKCRET